MLTQLALGFLGLLLLIILAAAVDRWPILGKVLVTVIVVWFIIALCIWIYRGDLFASSGMEASEEQSDGWAR